MRLLFYQIQLGYLHGICLLPSQFFKKSILIKTVKSCYLSNKDRQTMIRYAPFIALEAGRFSPLNNIKNSLYNDEG